MKLYCIGIGPGGEEQMTLRAVRALEKCDCVAGYRSEERRVGKECLA